VCRVTADEGQIGRGHTRKRLGVVANSLDLTAQSRLVAF